MTVYRSDDEVRLISVGAIRMLGSDSKQHDPAETGQQTFNETGRLTLAAAYSSVALGLVVLLGWGSGIEALAWIAADSVAMNPMTACCFIFSGSAVALHRFRFSSLAIGLGALVCAIALAKLVDAAVGGLPVDQILFPQLLDGAAGSRPNRMAPNTAAAFALSGCALFLIARKGRKAQLAAQGQAIGVLLLSMFALIGYAFGIGHLTRVGPFIPMALHTAFGLAALGIGILSLAPASGLLAMLRDRGPAGSLARAALPLAILIPIAAGSVRLWGEASGYYGMEAGVALMVVANVLITSALLVPSILAVHRSDKIRKDREQALRRSEQLNRTINEASPDAVSLLDGAGIVLFSNDAASRAYGLRTNSELLGRPWGARLDGSVAAARDAALAVAASGGVGRLTICLPGPDGDLRWFESLVSPLPEVEGQSFRFIVMSRDITEQKNVEDQVRWTATHDALTELPNRLLFKARLDELVLATGTPSFALLLLDVDDFKQVNDTLGHDAGDALLCTVAQRLREALRQEDFVARLGGDEFAIILDGVRSQAGAAAAAAKIFDALREPWLHKGQTADCRVSIGASIAPEHGEDASTLLKNADTALYAAKTNGRGQFAAFQPAMRAAMQERSSKLSLARHALQEDLIVPHYQPKVELRSGRLVGFEALLRWLHPSRGVQSPATIDAAFEDFETSREITDRMLDRVLSDMRRWNDKGVDFGHVAINLSAADFKDPGFAERLLERLAGNSIPASSLQVEVTETVFLGRGARHVEQSLKTLSAGGIRIALDDFGTGYASLSHLKQFPVDIVKIDRSFLRNVQADPRNAAIIRTVVDLGRSLHLDVVAEGVETLEEEAYLISQGCRFGQGYLYAEAASPLRVPALIASWSRPASKAA